MASASVQPIEGRHFLKTLPTFFELSELLRDELLRDELLKSMNYKFRELRVLNLKLVKVYIGH